MSSAAPAGILPEKFDLSQLSLLGPDFPFAYDDYLASPSGLGEIPPSHYGKEIAIVGAGLSGMVSAYELMKIGLKPVIYEAEGIGGRLRSERFKGYEDVIAEMGAMRFPLTSKALFHYIDKCGLTTKPFPNPLTPATNSTVIELKGQKTYVESADQLPDIYQNISNSWYQTLEQKVSLSAMQQAICERDIAQIKRIWDELVPIWDDRTFYGFLSESPAFKSFQDREIFGQVGFGTGGWNTDFPNSMLEILRVVYTGADDNHQTIVEGAQALPERLWQDEPELMAHWPQGTSLASLNGGETLPALKRIYPTAPNKFTLQDCNGHRRTYDSVILTPQSWMLLNNIRCDESLFEPDVWSAIENTHYMQASKTFVCVDRPFWKDKDERGQDQLSMTLTDRMTRGTYLLDGGDDKPSAICLSYTWTDDSLKLADMDHFQRSELMLDSLAAIYPNVDIRKHIVTDPLGVCWESEPNFMGAFKANLPGHYRYQHRLYAHFKQDQFKAQHRGIFLAGDDISWTAGWAEGAVTTALNAVWGVMNHLGGGSHKDNSGPGDRFNEIGPIKLP